MNDKWHVLMTALRAVAIEFIAAVEDFLDTPYDKSALAKRRAKAREYTNG